MAHHASLAEHYRAHRAAFSLALELGCTPKEAEFELEKRAARARWEAAEARLRSKMSAPLPRAASDFQGGRGEEPWMMRD